MSTKWLCHSEHIFNKQQWREATYHAWGSEFPKANSVDYHIPRELALVLATDLCHIADIQGGGCIGRSNNILQEVRVSSSKLLFHRSPRKKHTPIGRWVWRDETLKSVCLATLVHETTRYLPSHPSHVHLYAPQHIFGPDGPGWPIDVEIYLDGSYIPEEG